MNPALCDTSRHTEIVQSFRWVREVDAFTNRSWKDQRAEPVRNRNIYGGNFSEIWLLLCGSLSNWLAGGWWQKGQKLKPPPLPVEPGPVWRPADHMMSGIDPLIKKLLNLQSNLIRWQSEKIDWSAFIWEDQWWTACTCLSRVWDRE